MRMHELVICVCTAFMLPLQRLLTAMHDSFNCSGSGVLPHAVCSAFSLLLPSGVGHACEAVHSDLHWQVSSADGLLW